MKFHMERKGVQGGIFEYVEYVFLVVDTDNAHSTVEWLHQSQVPRAFEPSETYGGFVIRAMLKYFKNIG